MKTIIGIIVAICAAVAAFIAGVKFARSSVVVNATDKICSVYHKATGFFKKSGAEAEV